jgi:hypothetical protein
MISAVRLVQICLARRASDPKHANKEAAAKVREKAELKPMFFPARLVPAGSA